MTVGAGIRTPVLACRPWWAMPQVTAQRTAHPSNLSFVFIFCFVYWHPRAVTRLLSLSVLPAIFVMSWLHRKEVRKSIWGTDKTSRQATPLLKKLYLSSCKRFGSRADTHSKWLGLFQSWESNHDLQFNKVLVKYSPWAFREETVAFC